MRLWMLAAALASAAGPAFGQGKTQGTLPDVVIEAEAKRPISREKPLFRPEVKDEAPLEWALRTGDEVRFRIPAEVAQSTSYAPAVSNSPQVAIPSTNWILPTWTSEPVRVFFPLQELSKVLPAAQRKDDKGKARWEFSVVDSAGKAFRRYSGPGLPPERLEFDGRSDEGAWLRVGQVYTGFLSYYDADARSHTALSAPFALAGLGVAKPEGTVISLATRVLFPRQAASPELTDTGQELLREAAQLIQRHHPGLGVSVSAHVSRSDAAWAQGAAEACSKYLAGRLLLAAGAVAAKGQPGTGDLEERVDVIVGTR